MVLDDVVLSLDIASLVLILLAMVFLVKNREFERVEFERSMNAMLFGLLFYMLITIINLLDSLLKLYPKDMDFLKIYIDSLLNVSQLALMPFFGICFIVAVLFARDALIDYE